MKIYLNHLKLYEEFDYSKPYHKELQSKMLKLINTVYKLKVGDRVYNNDDYSKHKGKFGTVVSFYEKDWRKAEKPYLIGKPYIKWDGEDSVDKQPSLLQNGSGTFFDYKIMKVDVMEEYEKIKDEYFKLISVTKRLKMEDVIKDLKNEISKEDLKSKYNLTEHEYDYLLDSPEVRFAFS